MFVGKRKKAKQRRKMRIVKLHLGLFKYLRIELKKKRTLKQLIYFLRDVIKSYFKELLKQYRDLFRQFDPLYIKQKKEFDRYNKIKVDLQRAVKMLQYIDNQMAKMGKSRQQRRQFWRDFYKDGQVRIDVFNNLMKELGG